MTRTGDHDGQEVDLHDYEAVAHADSREEADFYRRLLAEHEIEVLFSDDLDNYEPEEGEQGIAILVPDDEVDTAYHLIQNHEETIATGGIHCTDDDDETDDDSDSEIGGQSHDDYDHVDHDEDDDHLDLGGHHDDEEPQLHLNDDDEH